MKKHLMVNLKTIILFLLSAIVLSSYVSATNYTGYQAFDYFNGTTGTVGTCQFCESGWDNGGSGCDYSNNAMFCTSTASGETMDIYPVSTTQVITCAYEFNTTSIADSMRAYFTEEAHAQYLIESGVRLGNTFTYKDSGGSWNTLMAISANVWYRVRMTYYLSNGNVTHYITNLANLSNNANISTTASVIGTEFKEMELRASDLPDVWFRNVSCWNGTWDNEPIAETTDVADITPPIITQVNFTSEGGQICGSGTTCGPTDDTTPSFIIATNENANCRIDDDNNNYTVMGGSRNCTSGMGSTSLTCTLPTDDALILGGTDYVYIACQDLSGNGNSTTITMNLTGADLGLNATSAILAGVTDAVLSNPVTYTSQQVYVRYADGQQNLTRFDVVASSASKRWFFNYILGSDVFTSLRQILPSIYVWENSTLTYAQVRSQVGSFVNATK